jgi:hypothetical protein
MKRFSSQPIDSFFKVKQTEKTERWLVWLYRRTFIGLLDWTHRSEAGP